MKIPYQSRNANAPGHPLYSMPGLPQIDMQDLLRPAHHDGVYFTLKDIGLDYSPSPENQPYEVYTYEFSAILDPEVAFNQQDTRGAHDPVDSIRLDFYKDGQAPADNPPGFTCNVDVRREYSTYMPRQSGIEFRTAGGRYTELGIVKPDSQILQYFKVLPVTSLCYYPKRPAGYLGDPTRSSYDAGRGHTDDDANSLRRPPPSSPPPGPNIVNAINTGVSRRSLGLKRASLATEQSLCALKNVGNLSAISSGLLGRNLRISEILKNPNSIYVLPSEAFGAGYGSLDSVSKYEKQVTDLKFKSATSGENLSSFTMQNMEEYRLKQLNQSNSGLPIGLLEYFSLYLTSSPSLAYLTGQTNQRNYIPDESAARAFVSRKNTEENTSNILGRLRRTMDIDSTRLSSILRPISQLIKVSKESVGTGDFIVYLTPVFRSGREGEPANYNVSHSSSRAEIKNRPILPPSIRLVSNRLGKIKLEVLIKTMASCTVSIVRQIVSASNRDDVPEQIKTIAHPENEKTATYLIDDEITIQSPSKVIYKAICEYAGQAGASSSIVVSSAKNDISVTVNNSSVPSSLKSPLIAACNKKDGILVHIFNVNENIVRADIFREEMVAGIPSRLTRVKLASWFSEGDNGLTTDFQNPYETEPHTEHLEFFDGILTQSDFFIETYGNDAAGGARRIINQIGQGNKDEFDDDNWATIRSDTKISDRNAPGLLPGNSYRYFLKLYHKNGQVFDSETEALIRRIQKANNRQITFLALQPTIFTEDDTEYYQFKIFGPRSSNHAGDHLVINRRSQDVQSFMRELGIDPMRSNGRVADSLADLFRAQTNASSAIKMEKFDLTTGKCVFSVCVKTPSRTGDDGQGSGQYLSTAAEHYPSGQGIVARQAVDWAGVAAYGQGYDVLIPTARCTKSAGVWVISPSLIYSDSLYSQWSTQDANEFPNGMPPIDATLEEKLKSSLMRNWGIIPSNSTLRETNLEKETNRGLLGRDYILPVIPEIVDIGVITEASVAPRPNRVHGVLNFTVNENVNEGTATASSRGLYLDYFIIWVKYLNQYHVVGTVESLPPNASDPQSYFIVDRRYYNQPGKKTYIIQGVYTNANYRTALKTVEIHAGTDEESRWYFISGVNRAIVDDSRTNQFILRRQQDFHQGPRVREKHSHTSEYEDAAGGDSADISDYVL